MTGAGFALWRGSPNHYNGRNGLAVNHITLHIMVGRLAGTDSCFMRSSFQAASHYGVGGDGGVYQWVDEDDGSWADANWQSDCSGITIEHEGGMGGIPVTDAEVEASARLCADIARRYGWKTLWHDAGGNRHGNIVLHREVPGTDHYGCPDRCVNALPVDRIIARANELLGGAEMALTDEDIMKIWTHKLPNGACVRDCLSPAIQDVFSMHDTGLTNGAWLHKLPNGRYARDVISDATSDVIRLHDTMIPQLTAQVTALTAAVKTLAESKGADPDQIAAAVENAVKAKLDKLRITVTDGQ